jgi:hypothetical protein
MMMRGVLLGEFLCYDSVVSRILAVAEFLQAE